MPSGDEQKDLLGAPIRKRRPKYEAALEKHELQHVPERAERVRWLNTIIPQGSVYMMPLASMKVFQEAKDCFIYGHHVATIVLAASFIEHWLGGILVGRGQQSISSQGLAAIVNHCREHGLLPAVLCEKADRLRKIRNPFVHLKSFDHPHGLSQRLIAEQVNPDALLETDAKDALVAMYSVAMYARSQT